MGADFSLAQGAEVLVVHDFGLDLQELHIGQDGELLGSVFFDDLRVDAHGHCPQPHRPRLPGCLRLGEIQRRAEKAVHHHRSVQLNGLKLADPNAATAPQPGDVLKLSKKHAVRFV